MENSEVKLGMKVTPSKKSYAQDLKYSQQWIIASIIKQKYLYVNYVHPSNTHGNVFVLGHELNAPNSFAGDFFLASDIEPFKEEI